MASCCSYGMSLAVLICLSSVSFAASPAGFKTRITTAALTYASKQAVDALAAELPNTDLPDQSGSSGHVSYSLEQICIKSFDKPSSTIQLNPGQGLTWSASNAGIRITAAWHAKYKKGWFKISDHGDLDVSVGAVTFSISIAVRTDKDGRPKVSAGVCKCHVGHANVHFDGGVTAVILNVFRKEVESRVKDMVSKKLCAALADLINNNAEKHLQKLKVVTGLLDNLFMLDYRQVGNPVFQTDFMENFFKGEITWNAKREQPPFSPAPLPSPQVSQHMLYLWVGQYVPDSFVYAAQHNNFLQYNMTAQDLPPGNRSLLNTTCTSFSCVGKIIPAVGSKYPGCTVEMRMKSTTLPLIKMETDLLGAKMAGEIAMYAHTPDGQIPYLLTLNVSAAFNMSATIKDQLLVGQITGSRFKVGVMKSAVGVLNEKIINTMVGLAMQLFIIPKMNEQGERGFPLLVTGDIRLVNTKVQIQKNALMVATDLDYQPNFSFKSPQKQVHKKFDF